MIDSTPTLRGQIFWGGMLFATSTSLMIGGLAMATGVDMLDATILLVSSFTIVGLIGFLAEALAGPSLERLAVEREMTRETDERDQLGIGGAALPSEFSLTGGQDAPVRPPEEFGAFSRGNALYRPPMMGGLPEPSRAAKGMALDITLPEETVPLFPALADGGSVTMVGSPTPEATARRVGRVPAPVDTAADTMFWTAQGATASGTPSTPDEEFRELASLLRDSGSAVPADAVRASS